MAISQAPRVQRKERDLSEVVAPAGTSVGATVGYAKQGIANSRVLNSTDQEWIEKFGTPIIDGVDYSGYAAIHYLKESDSLFYVRATDGSEVYANISVSEISASNDPTMSADASSTFTNDGNKPDDIQDITAISNSLTIASIGPGNYGNNIAITIRTSADAEFSEWQDKFDSPGLVFRVDVLVKNENDPDFSNVSGSPEETFFVTSKFLKAPDGRQLFAEDVINGTSEHIFVRSNFTVTGSIPASTTAEPLVNGDDGASSKSTSEIQSAWSLFTDVDKVKTNILIAPYQFTGNAALIQVVGNLAASRLDSIAVVQGDDANDLTTTSILANTLSFNIPSYVAKYVGWDRIFDNFEDRNILVPKAIFGAAIMARTDRDANPWNAPAGTNRGILGSSIGQNVVWSISEIGTLYDQNLNPSRFIRGQGHVLWGQKTAQTKRSALNRINVRRLLLFIEDSVEPTLVPFLFENNSDKTRLRVFQIVDAFLRQVEAGGGLIKFEVVVDETNNTPQVIDNNELVVDIFVQPTKTIEVIRLNVTITRTGVDFAEVR